MFSLPWLLGSSGVFATFFIATGFSAMSMTKVSPASFQIARFCFVASSVLPAVTIWYAATEFQMHLWARFTVAMVGAIAIGLALGYLLGLVIENERFHNEQALENDPITKAFRALQEKQARIQMGLEPESVEFERRRWMGALTREYISSHDNVSPAIIAGTELPPTDWLNKRISELNEEFRKRGKSFRLPPTKEN